MKPFVRLQTDTQRELAESIIFKTKEFKQVQTLSFEKNQPILVPISQPLCVCADFC